MCERGASTIVPTPDWLWDARAVPEAGICIDECIAEQLVAAWAEGVRTLGSCCGHGGEAPSVVLADDLGNRVLARAYLPGFTLYQWRLVDVTAP